MLNTIFKKKLSDDQLANVFVNGVLEVVDKGFSEVVMLIEEDPAFVKPPKLSASNDGHFTMIVIVGNMKFLSDRFLPEQLNTLEPLIIEKFAATFEMEPQQFEALIKDYASFMSRVNHPSKSVLYSMSKGLFHKYKLNVYQDEYFKKLDCPNPLFLKRMDEVMKNFIWNWDAFFKRYKMVG
ncbi:MAG: hypothetical protein R3277_09975 [Brumimicrobium sp.]|nr:hypothetical protein [Brumimicrobium sp.]